MSKTIQNAALRAQMRASRQAFTAAERSAAAEQAAEALLARPEYRSARSVAGYLACDGEFDVAPMLWNAHRDGKRCFVPVVVEAAMRFRRWTPEMPVQANRFGILEPTVVSDVDGHAIEMVLAPLLAFDSAGVRMGMGGGYYDRAFAFTRERREPHRTALVGAAFEAQRVESLQANSWDVPLDGVITERGWTDFRTLEET